MPYSLRKAPGRNKFWVVGQDGTHKSKEPLTKKKALAQMRALYAAEFRGGSFSDWFNPIKDLNSSISKAIQDGYDEALDFGQSTWDKIKQVGDLDSDFWVKQHYPTAVEETLNKHKDLVVESIILRKAPVQAALEYALEAFSLGDWGSAKKKMGYDTMFHLSVLVNGKFVVEKLARINIATPIDNPPNAEFEVVQVKGNITLGEMMEKTKASMGGKFFPYDPFQNNCQDFVDGVMMANKDVFDYGKKQREFVKQSVDAMIEDLPSFLPKFARTITSLGGLTGGAERGIVSANELLDMCRQSYKLVQNEKPSERIGEWVLVESTFTLLLYKKAPYYILVCRGSKEFRDVQAWKPILDNKLKDSTRYKDDLNTVKQWKKRHTGSWYGTGHSLGGALCDEFLLANMLNAGKAVSFNPAIEPEVLKTNVGRLNNKRIYFQGDPLYAIFGKFDPQAIVVTDPNPSWMSWLIGVDTGSHSLDKFEGQLDDSMLDGTQAPAPEPAPAPQVNPGSAKGKWYVGSGIDAELLATALEGSGLLRKEEYEKNTGEKEHGAINLGLRAIAHLDDDPLRRFGARALADDVFEYFNPHYDPNSKETKGHYDALNYSGMEALVQTKAEQRKQKARVDEYIEAWNRNHPTNKITRDVAYKYILEGKDVAPYVSPEERKALKEKEEKLAKEYAEAEEKREQDRIIKQMALIEQQKALAEIERLRNEAYEAQLEADRKREKEREEERKKEEDRIEAERLKLRAEEARIEEEKKKAREAEQEKARREKEKKKKKAKKGKSESEEEREEKEKKEDPEVAKLKAFITAEKEALSPKQFWVQELEDYKKAQLEKIPLFITMEAVNSDENMSNLISLHRSFQNEKGLTAKERNEQKNTVEKLEDARQQRDVLYTTYNITKSNVDTFMNAYIDRMKALKEGEYNLMVLENKLSPPDEEFKKVINENIQLAGQAIDKVRPEILGKWKKELWEKGYVRALGLIMDVISQAKNEIESLERKKETPEIKRDLQSQKLQLSQGEKALEKVKTESSAMREEWTALQKEAEELGKLKKGKGKHSYLARALGHLSVSKRKLTELRKRRAQAEEAGDEASFSFWDDMIQNVAKPRIEKQKADIEEKKESGTSGKGRQHKPFVYSREGMTQKEKAAERARHYRRVKKEKEEGLEKVGKEYVKVSLTEHEKKVEASRGLKPKKETKPKEASKRKAYIGSKMKKQFMDAGGTEESFKEAKKLYKEGKSSWESIIQKLV